MTRSQVSSFVSQHSSALILLAFGVLAVVMTWPVVAQLGTHLPGGTVDLWTHRWTYWWTKHAIAEGRNPFYTQLLFHPQGVSLAFHNIAWVNIAVWLPLQAVLGGNTAYSLTFLIFCTLNGFAMYLLAREFVDSLPAAFVGGLVYGFWPYTMSQFGHPNMKVTCWIPLALLYLRRTLDKRRVRDALLAALFLALTGLARWQSLVMGGIVIGLYLLYRCTTDEVCRTRRTLTLLVLVGLSAGVLMAPLAAPVAKAFLTRGHLEGILFTEETSAQTDLLAYVLPTPHHPLWCGAAEQIYENFIHNKVYVPFLGYATLALALYGAVRHWKHARFWLLVTGVYVALALGPQLRINGQLYPQVSMPYRLVGDLFIVRAVRAPDRFNLFLGLPVGMLVSLGTADLLRTCASRQVSALLVVAAGALILREYSLVPYHTERPVTPDWYHQLAQEPGQFAVLDLPMAPHTFDKRYMFYQITHGKPLVEGKVARPPHEAFAFIESTPFLGELQERNTMDPSVVNVSHQLRALAEADIRYIILHNDFATSEQLAAWQDWLTVEPLHQDEDLIVYATDPRRERDFTLTDELTDEIGLIRASFLPTSPIQGAVIHVDARWGTSAAPERDYEACVNLVNPHGEVAQSRCRPVSPRWPTSDWDAKEIVRSTYALHVDPSLEPASYSLTLTLADAATGAVEGAPAILGSVQIEALKPTHRLHVLLGDRILLRGYDLQQAADSLEVTLYWQAQRKMDTSYKIFVHLVDPTTGEIVVQDDAVPRRWTYPTTRWEPGEVVEDRISLGLAGVPAGQYRLTVGCYDPKTGKRLSARSADGERYPSDAVPLTTVQR